MDFDKKHLFNYQLLLKITKGKVQSFSKGFSILQLKIMNTKQVCLKAKEPEFLKKGKWTQNLHWGFGFVIEETEILFLY